MKFINSYKAKILNTNISLDNTLKVYRSAEAFLINVITLEWNNIYSLRAKEKVNFVENLVHNTKFNKASYDFDTKFYKLPSYLRRSAIQDAVGSVSSYKSNLENYENQRHEAISNGKRFRKKVPQLSLKNFKCPALYKGNMYIKITENTAKIKVFKNNDWVWQTISLRQQDINYINKNCAGKKIYTSNY